MGYEYWCPVDLERAVPRIAEAIAAHSPYRVTEWGADRVALNRADRVPRPTWPEDVDLRRVGDRLFVTFHLGPDHVLLDLISAVLRAHGQQTASFEEV